MKDGRQQGEDPKQQVFMKCLEKHCGTVCSSQSVESFDFISADNDTFEINIMVVVMMMMMMT